MNVVEILENAPMMIAQQEDVVSEKRKALDQRKNELLVAKAKAILSNRNVAKNQKILEALVCIDPEVIAHEAKVIEAEADARIAQIDLSELENQFTSARKLASLQITVGEVQGRPRLNRPVIEVPSPHDYTPEEPPVRPGEAAEAL